METELMSLKTKYLAKHNRKNIWVRILIVLSAIVVFWTTYAMVIPAITMEEDVYCGYESEHTEECYREVRELVCEIEESEEHTHTEDCYEIRTELICGKQIHQHTLQCFSNPEADVEDSAVWERIAGIELSGNARKDLVKVAATQIGYRESSNNYMVAEDGQTKKGYTRYGDKYGNRYGDWDVMFCKFCMDYANVNSSAVPTSYDITNWISALENQGLFETGNYTPEEGDIAFTQDGHCGIVCAVSDNSFQVIEGDRDDQVRKNEYNLSSDSIVGFGVLIKEESLQESELIINQSELDCQSEEKSTESEYVFESEENCGINSEENEEDQSVISSEDSDDQPVILSKSKALTGRTLRSNGAPSDTFYSSNLEYFITSILLTDGNGEEVTENSVVYLGEKYRLQLSFSESDVYGEEKQFEYNNDGVLTYQFDTTYLHFTEMTQGIIYNRENEPIGEYSISESGKLSVKFYYLDENGNVTTEPTATNIIDRSSMVYFDLEVDTEVTSTESSGQVTLDFANDVIIHVDVNRGGVLYTTKKDAAYDDASRSVSYVVEVGCSHGIVDNIYVEDSAELIIDNFVYGSNAMSVVNMTITDLAGNPVYDGENRVTNLEELNAMDATLTAGEGFLIKYTLKLADSVNTENCYSNGTINNTIEASGNTLEGPVSDDASKTTRFSIRNVSKNGTPYEHELENGEKVKLIRWSVTVGDYVNDQGGNYFTDTLGEGLSYYLGIAPSYTISAPETVRGTMEWNTEGNTGAVIDPDDPTTAVFYLPGSGTRYTITYYTEYHKGDTTYENSVKYLSFPNDTVRITMTGSGTTVFKEHYREDTNYIYYRVTAHIPAGKYNRFRLSDLLNLGGYRNIRNYPEQIKVVLEDPDGTQTELLPYGTGEGQSTTLGEYYYLMTLGTGKFTGSEGTFHILFNKTDYASDGIWPFTTEKTIILTYATPKSATSEGSGPDSITGLLNAGNAVDNTAKVYINNYEIVNSKDSIYHVSDVAKSGKLANINNGLIHYRVAIPNSVIVNGQIESSFLSSYYGYYIQDSFDERLSYVPSSMKATVYKHPGPNETGHLHSITHDTGRVYPQQIAIYSYSGEISDNTNSFTASFSDFNRLTRGNDYNGDALSNYSSLEALIRQYPDAFSVIIEYDMKVKDEYFAIDYAQKELLFTNEASLGFTTEGGNYLSDPATTTVSFTNKILEKTTGDLKPDDTLDFEIIVNSQNRDLTEAESIVIEDTMCSSLMLYLNTVKVDTGIIRNSQIVWTEVENPSVTYDRQENKLSVRTPDNVPVRIRYTCKVIGAQNELVSITNSVSIGGFYDCTNTFNAEYSVNSSASGGGDYSSYEVYLLKQDEDTLAPLPGAEFALYGPYNESRMGEPIPGISQTKTAHGELLYFYAVYDTETISGAMNGTFTVTDEMISNRGHYAFCEISAPEGYEPTEEIFDFYAIERPENYNEDIPLLADRATLTVGNHIQNQTFELSVKKEWDDIYEVEQHSAVIMKLYEGTDQSNEDNIIVTPVLDKNGNEMTLVLSSENEWQGSFTELDPEKTYYVFEVPVDGYLVNYAGGDTVTALLDDHYITAVSVDNEQATITVTNSGLFILPETGGTGTALFYVLGALILVGALAFIYVQKRRFIDN